MIKEFHETQEDRDKELAAILTFCKYRGECIPFKLPRTYTVDFAITSFGAKKILCFVEVRHRTHAFGDFPDVWSNMKKIQFASRFSQYAPVLFLVCWADGKMGWVDLSKPDHFIVGGRNEKRNDEDVEPLGVFGLEKFTMLGAWK